MSESVISRGHRISYRTAGAGPPLVLLNGWSRWADNWWDAGYVSMRIYEKNGLEMAGVDATPAPVGFKGWKSAIMYVFTDVETALSASLSEQANKEELTELREMLMAYLAAGALGIGLPLDYFSDAIQDAEMHMIFEVAAQRSSGCN